ncbi:hypothetical protein HOR19_gp25 [Phage MedPE-SWcel-C56]|uniref:Uncharacterized protein n=1 Tax=Phage MedPE-SWcel-C56 TaxID=1871314 RepID=A0A1B1IY14_9CAUD|nr:hypothetical protein HOR19_gp25 [Phage MedPE-SWcel-C56]ANS06218.1 hypothetical protein [Phage MedPE-SWcel-C56]
MSDLKHKTDDELVQIIRASGRYRARLAVELVAAEEQVRELKRRINNSAMRSEWAVRYLDGTAHVSNL